jgi:nitrate/nitrite transporter NarK
MPLGGMVVSLTAPALALAFGWQWAFAPMIAIAAIALSLNQYARPVWDAQRDPRTSIKGEALDAIPRVWREPALRWLAIGGFTLSAVQRMLLTYLVLYLVTERGYGLIEAGVALSVMHAAGFVARPLWGFIADRAQSGMRVLLLIGLIAMLGALALIHLDASWPALAVYGVCAALGISSIGWNGLFYAEITRIAGQGNAGAVTGGASFFVYAGVLTGPAVFAATFGFVGNYTDTLYTMVAISAAAIAALWIAQRRAATRAPVFA